MCRRKKALLVLAFAAGRGRGGEKHNSSFGGAKTRRYNIITVKCRCS